MNEKSYEVSPELEAEVSAVLAEGEAKYASISHIVLESDFDAGVFFEHELLADSDEPA